MIVRVCNAHFAWKQLKADYFQFILDLKRRKSWARFCLSLGWVHINANKLLKTAILLVQEAYKIGKNAFWPKFEPYFLDFQKA